MQRIASQQIFVMGRSRASTVQRALQLLQVESELRHGYMMFFSNVVGVRTKLSVFASSGPKVTGLALLQHLRCCNYTSRVRGQSSVARVLGVL
jgi:hypothetical protein